MAGDNQRQDYEGDEQVAEGLLAEGLHEAILLCILHLAICTWLVILSEARPEGARSRRILRLHFELALQGAKATARSFVPLRGTQDDKREADC